jgi:hypothetical protein
MIHCVACPTIKRYKTHKCFVNVIKVFKAKKVQYSSNLQSDQFKSIEMKDVLSILTIFVVATSVFAYNPASKAIAEVVEHFDADRFDLILYRTARDDLANEIAKTMKTPATITKFIENTKYFLINESSIMFFDDWKSFQMFHKKAWLANDFPRDFRLYVYVADFHDDSGWPNAKSILSRIFLHAYFFLDRVNQKHIDLVTFTIFQQPDCRKINPIPVNRFSKSTRKWESQTFEIEKFDNFNGCEIVVHMHEPSEPILIDIHKFLSASLDFKTKWVIFKPYEGKYVTERVPVDWSLAARTLRVSLGNSSSRQKLAMTHYTHVQDQMFIVSRSAEYTMAEKALLPLDSEVWYWLIGFMAVGMIVIVVVNFMKNQVKIFVFGLNFRAPLLNLM